MSITQPLVLTHNKYGARKTEHGGRVYDSAAEARRAQELELMLAAGVISDLQYQQPFDLHACADANRGQGVTCAWYPVKVARYIADFTYIENGKLVAEDCKGVRTAVYQRSKRHMRAEYGIEIREVNA